MDATMLARLVVNRRPGNHVGTTSRERCPNRKGQTVHPSVLEALQQVGALLVAW